MPKRLILSAAIFLGCVAGTGSAAEPAHPNVCHAVFRGTSTLHDFEGTVDASLASVEFGQHGWSLRIECAVAGMSTRNEARDRNMRRMFEYPKFPLIVVTGRDLPWPETGKPLKLPMSLKILDCEKTGEAILENWNLKDGDATFTLKGAVSLAEFGLKPPGVFFGMIRVGDRVELEGLLRIHHWQKAAN